MSILGFLERRKLTVYVQKAFISVSLCYHWRVQDGEKKFEATSEEEETIHKAKVN